MLGVQQQQRRLVTEQKQQSSHPFRCLYNIITMKRSVVPSSSSSSFINYSFICGVIATLCITNTIQSMIRFYIIHETLHGKSDSSSSVNHHRMTTTTMTGGDAKKVPEDTTTTTGRTNRPSDLWKHSLFQQQSLPLLRKRTTASKNAVTSSATIEDERPPPTSNTILRSSFTHSYIPSVLEEYYRKSGRLGTDVVMANMWSSDPCSEDGDDKTVPKDGNDMVVVRESHQQYYRQELRQYHQYLHRISRGRKWWNTSSRRSDNVVESIQSVKKIQHPPPLPSVNINLVEFRRALQQRSLANDDDDDVDVDDYNNSNNLCMTFHIPFRTLFTTTSTISQISRPMKNNEYIEPLLIVPTTQPCTDTSSNTGSSKNNIDHANTVDDKLYDVIHDWETICQSMTPFTTTSFITVQLGHPGGSTTSSTTTTAVELTRLYQTVLGMTFDHIYVFQQQSPAIVRSSSEAGDTVLSSGDDDSIPLIQEVVPDEWKLSFHPTLPLIFPTNDTTSTTTPTTNSLTTMIQERFTKDDFIALKINLYMNNNDATTATTTESSSLSSLRQLLHDNTVTKWIDRVYVELCFDNNNNNNDMNPTITTTIDDSIILNLLRELRLMGIAAHYLG